MKNKGFTLIELLAVLVILAVVALIAFPVITGIIEKTKKSAALRSVEGYVEAANNAAVIYDVDNNKGIGITDTKHIFTSSSDTTEFSKIKAKGTLPTYSYIDFNTKTKAVSEGHFCISGYSVIYENNQARISDNNYCGDEENVEVIIIPKDEEGSCVNAQSASDKPIYKPDMVIVDEAHMFGTFYSNWLNVDISKNEVANIIAALGDKPQAMLFKTFLERGEPIPTQLLNRIIELIKAYYKKIPNMSQYGYELCSRLINFSSDFKNNEDVYFIISPSGMTRINFWHKFNIAQSTIKYRLFTATLDRFTRIMFGMNPDDYDNNFYIEKNLNLIDYTKSDAYVIKINDFNTALNDFIKLCEEKDYKSGLILSTTIENVSNLKEQGNVGRYKVYTKINDFRDADGYKVLVGSRAMFQGIDIPEINFVAINKIPFETYDEEFKKRVVYLKKWASIDPWTDYSIPLVKNSLIQSTGRLWRGPDNFGSIAIFDGRLVERFKYLLDTIIDVRNGISLYISGNDKSDLVEDFEEIIQDESKIKK